MNKTTHIKWMMDETIASAHPKDWGEVNSWASQLVSIIGGKDFSHEVVDPVPCFEVMASKLGSKSISTVIDLTGWLKTPIREIFPHASIVDDFSLSRVRVVSSPRLETTGYMVSKTKKEIEEMKNGLDWGRPLIIDDTGYSGSTNIKTMELFGIPAHTATHAFFIGNIGRIGENGYGSVPRLREMGSQVVYGHELISPKDDGWHLKDLHENANIEEAFDLALRFQRIIAGNGIHSREADIFMNGDGVVDTLFPDHMTTDQVLELSRSGRFMLRDSESLGKGDLHARNPFLWASPYFLEHINLESVSQNRDEIVGILKEMRTLTNDPEAKFESCAELRSDLELKRGLEASFYGLRERL